MDPQPFVRLSVGQLGLKLPGSSNTKPPRLCHCKIRLAGFPVQTAPVPLLHSSELNTLDPFTNAAVFSLAESDLTASPSTPACLFRPAPRRPRLDVAVYLRGGMHCGIVGGRRLVGVFRVEVGAEWRDGKPVMLHHGWVGIGRGKPGETRAELHLRVKMEADPRYVFQFDDEVVLNPQVVQIHGATRQPIFSCKFVRDRRPSQTDPLGGWSSSGSSDEKDAAEELRKREAVRKGWKVAIHDLSGSAVAAAFMCTPFVPAPGGDTVAASNPGAWLIVRADTTRSSDSWQPWGRLEAWRDGGQVRLRLRLLPERQDEDYCVLVSEARLRSDRGGEFAIDMDRREEEELCAAAVMAGCAGGGFVMSCVVEGEARGGGGPSVVQLAARHVACMEDAAMFVALAAAVDLSVKACRPFRRNKPPAAAAGRKTCSFSPRHDALDELDT
ncbi:hypothetical protein PR202_ga30627 [Eleusine coracana subsp. coracana]|uniref:Uncharacterized protein n=1 Tax=Eleusine coracana subsp. coracana TaxID=191504 RepID=A0AAV5DQ43_ELECO|nr:hypothetical protein QOZ80_8AG0618670 [Eleusine coracana subsp. coracana]GJN12356.1 hypothetical protein PR202_ga30627 [Eleusine coracana subsp. coracana]